MASEEQKFLHWQQAAMTVRDCTGFAGCFGAQQFGTTPRRRGHCVQSHCPTRADTITPAMRADDIKRIE
ncbi:MAG: hypothetical protein H7335_12560 [Massilia sp.]|nr:hypothetical protein [Massilia sp.]